MKLSHLALLILFVSGGMDLLAQRPLGVDVSDYQTGINWATARAGGIVFAWAKATEGLTINDSEFVYNEVNGTAAGVYIGAYHYAHPETHLGTAGADLEAAHFWSVASNYITGSNIYLMPALDIEANVTGANPPYTQATLTAWANEWCDFVTRSAASNGVVVNPVVYTFVSWATGTAGYGPGFDTTITNRPLWMAQYPLSTPDPQVTAPGGTAPWPSWQFWQYGSTNATPGVTTTGNDVDVFNGTMATLAPYLIGNTNGILPPSATLTTILSPAINVGDTTTFTASVSGSLPLTYQWKLNGMTLSGKTNLSLAITNAQLRDNGNYTLMASNAAGSSTSAPIELIVYPLQAVVYSDDFEVNSSTSWTLNQSSADSSATFSFDYASLGIPAAPHSVSNSTKGLQLKANLSAGVVAAVSLSPNAQSFSGDYRLRFDGWINVNGPLPGGGTGSTEFLTAGIGTAGNRTEWKGPGSAADGYYFAIDGDGGVSATSTTSGDYEAFFSTNLYAVGSGVYAAGGDNSAHDNAGIYSIALFPAGKAPPAYQAIHFPQQTGSLAAGTFGFAWHDMIVSRRGSTVDWVMDGVRVASISNATFTASNVFVGFWDQFPSLSSNNAINFGLVDNVRVEVPAVAPVITMQPASRTNPIATSTAFSVTATGTPAPEYYWRFNGNPIPGARGAIYSLSGLHASNAGNYSVLGSNLAGSLLSSNTLLTVSIPAFAMQKITAQGKAIQFSVTGVPGSIYAIDFSTNLTGWTQIGAFTNTTATYLFSDMPSTNNPVGFYRARFVGP